MSINAKYSIVFWPLVFLLIHNSLMAQTNTDELTVEFTIPEIAILDIAPNTSSISLSFNAPTEAGLSISGDTDNSKWLNYTSCIASGGSNRSISVQTDIDVSSQGIKLKVLAAAASNDGSGTLGTPLSSALTLSTTAQTLISGIGGCYTGNNRKGHNLTYSIEPANTSDYSKLTSDNTISVTVTYTITN